MAKASSPETRKEFFEDNHPGAHLQRHVNARRWIWLLVSVLCFGIVTIIAFTQDPRPDPAAQPALWQWFTEPIETNAWRRLARTGGALSGVFFRDKRQGWAVGARGTILITDNGGVTWRPQNSESPEHLHSVHFVDARNGWVVGARGTILATTDGGFTWRRQDARTLNALYSVRFIDSRRGWAVGGGDSGGATILRTSDGGNTWTPENLRAQFALTCVYFVDGTHGWIVGSGGTIFATSDGGTTWIAQLSGTRMSLRSVSFVDSRRGWIVGSEGTILVTSDGATWRPQASPNVSELSSVSIADPSHGWIVGNEGTILTTSDGGATWRLQASGTSEGLNAVSFVDTNFGVAVGAQGAMTTHNGGASWRRQASDIPTQFLAIHFSDSRRGWTVGDAGAILATKDGGSSWSVQDSRTRDDLFSVHFFDADHGWTVGEKGTIRATRDGGTTWTGQEAGTSESLYSVHFVDGRHGWAVGQNGIILITDDGGSAWKAQKSGISKSLLSVHFVDGLHGWAVGQDGTILVTRDGGSVWGAQTSGVSEWLRAIYFIDGVHGWAAGANGRILATSDGGSQWTRQLVGTKESLSSVHFADSARGWAVGQRGTVVATENGGSHWTSQESGSPTSLQSVYFMDRFRGWIVGRGDTILSTSDGGQSWRNIDRPSRFPAPWYYLALALCLLTALPALRPEMIIPPADSAANRQVSDNPIGPGDLDALGLGDIALGMSQFFRNLDTKPPLTVAVLGEWGQGKSSVMRLLEADLKKTGIYPVWFNAWHYQKEDHLLAYLLQAIRKQAVPRWHTLQGMRFKARLLGVRASRSRWTFALLIVLLAFCIGLLQHPQTAGKVTAWLENLSKLPWEAGSLLAVGSLGTALILLKQLYEALKAFHADPAALIKEAANSASIKDLRTKANLRMAFADEFKDVTRALEPYRMVIFIDDLDRCNPRSVTQILESVNFLISAGDCFVVMGLAKPQVEASVGLSFKDVADELGGKGEDAKEKRRTYAQQYLRKLINLEIRVPTATPEQQEVLLAGRIENTTPKPETYAERLAGFGRANRPIAWVIGTFMLAGLSLWYGLNLKLEEPPRASPPITTQASTNDAQRPEPTKPLPTQIVENDPPPGFVPGVPEASRLLWLPAGPAILLCALAFWVLTRRPNEVIRDSQNFTDALKIWKPLIGSQYRTPREIKRFLNRVRYLAMRWRKPSLQKPLIERWVDWAQVKLSQAKPDREIAVEIDEPEIVMMAALEGLGGERAPSDEDNLKAIAEHAQRFGKTDPNWSRFRQVTGEVESN